MKRRDSIALLGGASAWPLAARAQQKTMSVVGVLSGALPSDPDPFMAAFHQGLGESGYVEGQNVTIERRWTEGHYDRLPALAVDLVGPKVEMIVALAAAPARAAKSATSTIPIVFAGVGDPVGVRPGRQSRPARRQPHRLQHHCRRAESQAARAAFRAGSPSQGYCPAGKPEQSDYGSRAPDCRYMQEAARARGVQLAILKAGTESEIDAAFATLVGQHAGGLVVAGDPFFNNRREQLVAQAARHAVPAGYMWREVASVGGLISYGVRITDTFRQAGSYTGRILKGAKPADLPVQQPTTFDLVVNLKTAKALGLAVPPSILARADEVVE